jgi:imidazoleglycerol-phosphate dehydratase
MTRTAARSRVTTETDVSVTVDLDGTGATSISTGIGMLDHLLTSFGHHASIDLDITTRGDTEVDDHHTVEDTMLVLGAAVSDALGDRVGLERFGQAAIPMDEAIARCAVDYGGRPYAVIAVTFHTDRIGAMSTQMVEHGIEAYARAVGATIHVDAVGRNDHHIAEAVFKSLARATRAAISLDDRRTGLPSTKGSL